MIQVGNNKTVERDHTQLLPRERDPHGCAVSFEVTADAFDSNDDGEEDEYIAERILWDKPDPRTVWGRLCKVLRKNLAASRDFWEPSSSFVPRPYGSTTSRLRTSSCMSRTCWFTGSGGTKIDAITLYACLFFAFHFFCR